MEGYQNLYPHLDSLGLNAWLPSLQAAILQKLAKGAHGNLATWQAALKALPPITPTSVNLQDKIEIGSRDDLSRDDWHTFICQLKAFCPWRKGPFHLFGLTIDAEWRSDWKWQRLLPHITPLKDRTVLDVGCGNGYYGWRMIGAGARLVIGVDPVPLFVMQYQVMQAFINADNHYVLPLTLEDMPPKMACFDTVFSMGVIYHRRSPLDHLRALAACLRPGGELVLETLVIEGVEGMTLLPQARYAKMKNVWFIPTIATAILWLERCGFIDVRCVHKCATTHHEQRATEWTGRQSLADFLHPHCLNQTIEGYPAPIRAIFIAKMPD